MFVTGDDGLGSYNINFSLVGFRVAGIEGG